MAYNLRDRKNKAIFIDSSSSSSESDSDPDYLNRSSGQRFRIYDMAGPSNGHGQLGQGSASGDSSSVMADTETVVRRRPGRPPRNAAPAAPVEFGEVPRRARRRIRTRSLGSLTKRPNPWGNPEEKRTVMALLVDTDIVKENERVQIWDEASNRTVLQGHVTRDGVLCDCCGEVVTSPDFLAHSRSTDAATMPSCKIVVARNQFTLLGCQFLAWVRMFVENKWPFANKYDSRGNANDESDDACIVCADGGDLICCDRCPLTFHAQCLKMESVPGDTWVCPCCLCRYCGQAGSQEKEIAQCHLCEKSFHLNCTGVPRTMASNDTTKLFCGNVCTKLNEKLESMVGVKRNMDEGFSWTLLHHTICVSQYSSELDTFYKKIESNTKIALAWFLMYGCFEPIIDRLTKIDVLRSVIYNTSSEFTRIDFKGFYTVVLEKDDEVIAAASLRLRGKELAEMPFVATQWSYRNKGMLRKLMSGVESALAGIDVENLVIPSVEDVEAMWIQKFGFTRVSKALDKHVALSKMVMFPKSTRLMKSLVSNSEQSLVYDNGGQGGVGENGGKTMRPFDLNLKPGPED